MHRSDLAFGTRRWRLKMIAILGGPPLWGVEKGKELQGRSETALAPLMAPSTINLSIVGKRKNPTMVFVAIVPFSA
jgi:hypothetical protein